MRVPSIGLASAVLSYCELVEAKALPFETAIVRVVMAIERVV